MNLSYGLIIHDDLPKKMCCWQIFDINKFSARFTPIISSRKQKKHSSELSKD